MSETSRCENPIDGFVFAFFFFNLQLLDERPSANVLRFLEAINGYAFVL